MKHFLLLKKRFFETVRATKKSNDSCSIVEMSSTEFYNFFSVFAFVCVHLVCIYVFAVPGKGMGEPQTSLIQGYNNFYIIFAHLGLHVCYHLINK